MIWYIYILIDSIVNWYMIVKRGITPLYLPMNLIRGIIAIVYGGYIFDVQVGEFINWFVHVAFPFPFLFNTLLNTWRKKEIDYMGHDSGWIDSFVVRHNMQRLWYWISLIMFLISFKTL